METTPSLYQGQDLEVLANLTNYQNWILKLFKPYLRGKVLEFGAGIGNISLLYQDIVNELVLIEPAKNLFPLLTARMDSLKHVTCLNNKLKDLINSYKDFDSIISINVLEHIEDDIDSLIDCHTLLKPEGKLLLFVPALNFLYGTLDKKVEHRRRYSKSELSKKVKSAGFKIEKIYYFDFLGIAPWFLAGKILKRKSFDQKAALLYDKIGVPVGKFIEENLFRPIIGKNLILVAKKDIYEA